ncbi:MAG: hypothetical protein O9306_15985 [Beijerinckiaceae bacterium]|jgi:hypothetical protein|nr:hypothetical protein [Beijerinckiaceae bacterium]
MRNEILVACIAALAGACSYTPGSTSTDAASAVGGTGGISYNHEKLGNKQHLLTVNAAPGLGETESSIVQRAFLFANRFAARQCPSGFSFQNSPGGSAVSAAFMQRTLTYSFRCN